MAGPVAPAQYPEQTGNLSPPFDFEMTVRLTALFAAPDSGVQAAIAIGEPDPKRARQDSNL
jgi:hypothetical protein